MKPAMLQHREQDRIYLLIAWVLFVEILSISLLWQMKGSIVFDAGEVFMEKLNKYWALLVAACLGLLCIGIDRLCDPPLDLTFAGDAPVEVWLNNQSIGQALSAAFAQREEEKWKTDPDLPPSVRALDKNDIFYHTHEGIPVGQEESREIVAFVQRLQPARRMSARENDAGAQVVDLSFTLRQGSEMTTVRLRLYNGQYAYFSADQQDHAGYRQNRTAYFRMPTEEALGLIEKYAAYMP